MKTLLLDQSLWDLVLDANGNIALASEPYSISQDVASRCRVFLGDCWYNTAQGIDYFGQVFGSSQLRLLAAALEREALQVPLVIKARAVIQFANGQSRKVTGQIQFIDVNGNSGVANI